MIVKDLETMESVVKSNKALSWDGWTVISSYPSDKGRTSKNGVAIDSKWYLQTRYEPGADGWDIPLKFMG